MTNTTLKRSTWGLPDNMKMDLKETEQEGVEGIILERIRTSGGFL
jgi:hypothetical protein